MKYKRGKARDVAVEERVVKVRGMEEEEHMEEVVVRLIARRKKEIWLEMKQCK